MISKDGVDVTEYFLKGANIALEICQKNDIKIALLKSNSPSCSNSKIYDGRFSKRLVYGVGITTRLLQENGIKVFNEHQIKEMILYIDGII